MKSFLKCFAGVLFAFLIGAGCVQFSISTDIKITDLISSLSAVATAIIAWVGVNSWRKQLKFAARTQLMTDFHTAVIMVRDNVLNDIYKVPSGSLDVVSNWCDNKEIEITKLMQKIELVGKVGILNALCDMNDIYIQAARYKTDIMDIKLSNLKDIKFDNKGFIISSHKLHNVLMKLSNKILEHESLNLN